MDPRSRESEQADQGSDRRPAPFLLEAATVVGGILFPAGSLIGRDEEGRLWRCRLGGAADVLGIPCAADEISFFPGGGLASCRLGRDHTLSGCRCRAGEMALFHPEGSLFRGILAAEVERDGFLFLKGDEICLHPNGRVASLVLHRSATIGRLRFAKGTRLWLDEAGRPRAGVLREDGGQRGRSLRVFRNGDV